MHQDFGETRPGQVLFKVLRVFTLDRALYSGPRVSQRNRAADARPLELGDIFVWLDSACLRLPQTPMSHV